MNTLHHLRRAAFAAFTFLMVVPSFGDTFVIIDGPGAGTVIEGTPTGGGFFDVTDEDPEAPTAGTIIPTDVECPDPHYHGTLFGEPDPNPQGCGWGRVQNVTDVAERLVDLRNAIAANIGDTVLKAKLNAILDAIVKAVKDECFSVSKGAADAFGHELTGAFVREAINQATVNTINQAFLAWWLGVSQQILNVANAVILAGGKQLPPPPPPPAPQPCKVRILMPFDTTGSPGKLADPGGTFTIRPGNVLSLIAEGSPEPGTYEWKINPDIFDPAKPFRAGFASSANRASFLSERNGMFTITVTFTDKNGRKCKDMLIVKINDAYLRDR